MLADRPSLVRHASRLLAVAFAFLACATVAAATARAQDLIILNGDPPQTMSGSVQYDVVYIDGDLELLGDTTLTASSIYIGPDANLDTCYVPGPSPSGGDNACTAGRSLTLQAGGPVIVSDGIDLSGGNTGTAAPGGNLTISGNPVAVGDINTGPYTSGAATSTSGQVSITSGGTLATGGIYAPGAGVTLKAAGAIDVADDLQTQGTGNITATTPGRAASAGPVSIASSGGDVNIDGTIDASGNYGSGGTLGGGNGASVTISGGNVRTEQVETTGGGSQNSLPGGSAPVSITAGAALDALGSIDASGQNGAGGSGAPGSQVSLSATGPLTTGDDVDVSGGQGAAAGQIMLAGSGVTTGGLDARGGGGGTSTSAGGAGGSITVTAPAGASLGSVLASGGSGGNGATGAGGGPINVTSSGGSIDTGKVDSYGGSTGVGPGAGGGSIALDAHANLTVGGSLDSSGSNAGGSASPPSSGGNGGSLTLHADTGTLSLDGYASSAGGTGSNPNSGFGGSGGNGAPVVVVAQAIGALASLSSAGGDGGSGGTTQGPGGPGGAILAFTTSPIFDAHKLVTSDGGNGNPTGVAGAQHQDTAPSAVFVDPQSGMLSFTSNSPDALGYQVLMAVGTAAPTVVLSTAATSGVHPTAPVCQQVTFTVEAVDSTVGWTSAPSPGVLYTQQPSATQTCSQAPAFTVPSIKHLSRRHLRRDKWVVSVPLKLNGIGTLQATLVRLAPRGRHRRRKGKAVTVITTPSVQVTRPGVVHLRISLPSAGRGLATYKLEVTTTSPDGTGHASRTLGWEIVK